LGLGLTLARELVQLHGGTLTAHSEGIGMGSEFVLKLPAAGLQTTADAV
jgi:signal transduction histidine kinase